MKETISYGLAALAIASGGDAKQIVPVDYCIGPDGVHSSIRTQDLDRYNQLVDTREPRMDILLSSGINPEDLSLGLKVALVGALLTLFLGAEARRREFSEHATRGQKRLAAAALITQIATSAIIIADTFK